MKLLRDTQFILHVNKICTLLTKLFIAEIFLTKCFSALTIVIRKQVSLFFWLGSSVTNAETKRRMKEQIKVYKLFKFEVIHH